MARAKRLVMMDGHCLSIAFTFPAVRSFTSSFSTYSPTYLRHLSIYPIPVDIHEDGPKFSLNNRSSYIERYDEQRP